jgi:hypothetical protein
MEHLDQNGYLKNNAKSILEYFAGSRWGELVRDRLDEDESAYPSETLSIIKTGVLAAATEHTAAKLFLLSTK